jgi:predicted RNA-binding Zn-ribbon protein involved in translation (DUF1610 family)
MKVVCPACGEQNVEKLAVCTKTVGGFTRRWHFHE